MQSKITGYFALRDRYTAFFGVNNPEKRRDGRFCGSSAMWPTGGGRLRGSNAMWPEDGGRLRGSKAMLLRGSGRLRGSKAIFSMGDGRLRGSNAMWPKSGDAPHALSPLPRNIRAPLFPVD